MVGSVCYNGGGAVDGVIREHIEKTLSVIIMNLDFSCISCFKKITAVRQNEFWGKTEFMERS